MMHFKFKLEAPGKRLINFNIINLELNLLKEFRDKKYYLLKLF